jgi:hypothetical protein
VVKGRGVVKGSSVWVRKTEERREKREKSEEEREVRSKEREGRREKEEERCGKKYKDSVSQRKRSIG